MMKKAVSLGTALLLLVTALVTAVDGAGAFSTQAFATSVRPTASQRRLSSISLRANNNKQDVDDTDSDNNTNHDSNNLDSSSPSSSVENLRGGNLLALQVPAIPNLASYRKFALPCLGLWVMGPLLSLVDTAFVGLSGDASASAAQLAALGPATTFFDGATYLFAFLNVATTNLYSSAVAQHGPHAPKTESVVRTAARVALLCGVGVTGLLLLYSKTLLGLYIGECIYMCVCVCKCIDKYQLTLLFPPPSSTHRPRRISPTH